MEDSCDSSNTGRDSPIETELLQSNQGTVGKVVWVLDKVGDPGLRGLGDSSQGLGPWA